MNEEYAERSKCAGLGEARRLYLRRLGFFSLHPSTLFAYLRWHGGSEASGEKQGGVKAAGERCGFRRGAGAPRLGSAGR